MELTQPVLIAVLIFIISLIYTLSSNKKTEQSQPSKPDEPKKEQGCLVKYVGKITR